MHKKTKKRNLNRRTSKRNKKGGFFSWFSRKAPIVDMAQCDPNNLPNLKSSDELQMNYQQCCPKSFFGFKNSSPYCKQVDLNYQSSIQGEEINKEYIDIEPEEIYQMKKTEMPKAQFQGPTIKGGKKRRQITKRSKQIENETIMSNIGEPYLMEDMLSPLTVTLTSDQPKENGGLSYLHNYTNNLNIKLVHDYYRDYLNIQLPSDTKIIFGSAASMMIPAYYYALQKKENKTINVNTNLNIFYLPHKLATYAMKNVEWVNSNIKSDLSVIASPSNPLGKLTDPKDIKSKYILFDLVYDVYLFTGKYETVNPELYKEFEKNKNISIVFSFSKFGIAGVRFGFLLTRDNEIAKYAEEYVSILSVNYSTSSTTIARLAYYKYLRSKKRNQIIYSKLKYRREFFLKYAEKHNIKILNETYMVPYLYTDKSSDWWLKMFNVSTISGQHANDTENHSRFNLMLSEKYWNEFERRFIK